MRLPICVRYVTAGIRNSQGGEAASAKKGEADAYVQALLHHAVTTLCSFLITQSPNCVCSTRRLTEDKGDGWCW
eukprot:366020-Chlamydomonas_euryale.AAC.7